MFSWLELANRSQFVSSFESKTSAAATRSGRVAPAPSPAAAPCTAGPPLGGAPGGWGRGCGDALSRPPGGGNGAAGAAWPLPRRRASRSPGRDWPMLHIAVMPCGRALSKRSRRRSARGRSPARLLARNRLIRPCEAGRQVGPRVRSKAPHTHKLAEFDTRRSERGHGRAAATAAHPAPPCARAVGRMLLLGSAVGAACGVQVPAACGRARGKNVLARESAWPHGIVPPAPPFGFRKCHDLAGDFGGCRCGDLRVWLGGWAGLSPPNHHIKNQLDKKRCCTVLPCAAAGGGGGRRRDDAPHLRRGHVPPGPQNHPPPLSPEGPKGFQSSLILAHGVCPLLRGPPLLIAAWHCWPSSVHCPPWIAVDSGRLAGLARVEDGQEVLCLPRESFSS